MSDNGVHQLKRNVAILGVLVVLTIVSVGSGTDWTFKYYQPELKLILMVELCLIASLKVALILHYYMELGKAPLRFQLMAYSLIGLVAICILKMPVLLEYVFSMRLLI